jgi:hypothetical protein
VPWIPDRQAESPAGEAQRKGQAFFAAATDFSVNVKYGKNDPDMA